jgi:very-short-patch-repair endonuclease
VTLSLDHCRDLRRSGTDAERALWTELRGRRLAGFKFRRQHPCGPFILGFYCPECHLAIELDGGQHFEEDAQLYDARRSVFLKRSGVDVLRFATDLVFSDRLAVLEEIARALGIGSPSP